MEGQPAGLEVLTQRHGEVAGAVGVDRGDQRLGRTVFGAVHRSGVARADTAGILHLQHPVALPGVGDQVHPDVAVGAGRGVVRIQQDQRPQPVPLEGLQGGNGFFPLPPGQLVGPVEIAPPDLIANRANTAFRHQLADGVGVLGPHVEDKAHGGQEVTGGPGVHVGTPGMGKIGDQAKADGRLPRILIGPIKAGLGRHTVPFTRGRQRAGRLRQRGRPQCH